MKKGEETCLGNVESETPKWECQVEALSRYGSLESRGQGWAIIGDHRHKYIVTETREFKIMKECGLRERQGGRKGKEKREGRDGGRERGKEEGERRRGHRIKVEKFQHLQCGLSWGSRLERVSC